MRRFMTIGIGVAVVATMLTAPAASAVEGPPPNAIVSEGNGAAVFIGWGGDRSVTLSWRPSKKYEDAQMLYQVQRSDGAMIESRTRATSLTDRGLTPNSNYSYQLTVYQSITKTFMVKGERVKRTSTKRVGTNRITVLTLPTMVVGLTAALTPTSITVNWQPPQYAPNSAIVYSVKLNGNVMAYALTTFTYSLTGLTPDTPYTVEVVAENASGMGKDNAGLRLRTPE